MLNARTPSRGMGEESGGARALSSPYWYDSTSVFVWLFVLLSLCRPRCTQA